MVRLVAVTAVLPVVSIVKAPGCRGPCAVGTGKLGVMLSEMRVPLVAFHAYGMIAVAALDQAHLFAAVYAEAAVGAAFDHAEAETAVDADVLVVHVLKAVLAAGAAEILGFEEAAVETEAAVIADLGNGLQTLAAAGAEVGVVGRILTAHAAVGAPVLFTAELTETAVLAGFIVALIEADELAGRAELALELAVRELHGAPFVLAVAADGAVVGAAGTLVAVVADELIAILVSFAAAVAFAAFLAEHVRIIAIALPAVDAVKVLIFQAVIAEDVAALGAAAVAVVKRRNAFVAVIAVDLHAAIAVDAFIAYAAGRADIIFRTELLAHLAELHIL